MEHANSDVERSDLTPLEAVAVEIKEILGRIRRDEISPVELDGRLLNLRERSPSGYKVLLSLLRKTTSTPSLSEMDGGGAAMSSASLGLEPDEATMTEMPLSADDFLSLEEALNAGPFADFSGLDEAAASLGAMLSVPPSAPRSPQLQQQMQQQQQQEQNLNMVAQRLESAFETQQQGQQQQQLQTQSVGVNQQRQQQQQQPQQPLQQPQRQQSQSQDQNSPQNQPANSPSPKTSSRDPLKRARFTRTADILAKSGLLDITMATAELMRKNQRLNRQIAQLRRDTDAFVRDVLSNPENAHFAAMYNNQQQQQQGQSSQRIQSPSLMVGPNLDFHVVDERGRVTPVETKVQQQQQQQQQQQSVPGKRKVEVISEPMAFEDAAEMTSLQPKRSRLDT